MGLRPTLPLVSRAGMMPFAPTRDMLGPLTRTVADAAQMLAVMAGPDPAIIPVPLDIELAGEILFRLEVGIGKGRNTAHREVLVELDHRRVPIRLAEIRGDVPVLVRIVGE